MSRELVSSLISWLRPDDVVQIPRVATFEADPTLEHRQKLAREKLVAENKHGDRERRTVLRVVK
jgi:hypothetical protein